jgi:hypothetical protein
MALGGIAKQGGMGHVSMAAWSKAAWPGPWRHGPWAMGHGGMAAWAMGHEHFFFNARFYVQLKKIIQI